MESRSQFGEGITGWAALHREPVRTNEAHNDPRTKTVPGTPDDEPEALITVPLIARDVVKGVLNIYRLGEHASFSDEEFELTSRFADAAALALDNAQIRARLEYQAQTDSLTGLYNHRYFHDRLRAELTRASRARDCVAVLMLDIDDFKRVNDVYGHGAGDQVLTELADLLRAALRGSDVVCRLGGEEFGVIMAGGDAGDALNLARRLTDTLAEFEFGAGRQDDDLGRHLRGPAARDEPARAGRLLRGRDDDREGTGQEPDRALRRAFDRAPRRRAGGRPRRPLDRAPEDASEPGGQAQPSQRRAADRRGDRRRAPAPDRLPQLPRLGDRGRRGRADRLPRRARLTRRRARRPAAHEDRRGHHRARSGNRRAPARRQHARVRLRGDDPRHAHHRGVARRGAALLRHPGDRRDRHVEARRRPVRRGGRSAARGARGPCVRRARERASLRVPATGGRPSQGAARVHGRDLAGRRRRTRSGTRPCRPPRTCSEARTARSGCRSRTATTGSPPTRTTTTIPRSSRCSTWCFPPRRSRAIVGERIEPFLLGAGEAKRHAPSIPSGRISRSRRSGTTRSLEGFISVREPTGASTRSRRSCACSRASRYQAAVALERARASRTWRTRSSRRSRHWRTRSRPTTSTPRRTRAGSPTWR